MGTMLLYRCPWLLFIPFCACTPDIGDTKIIAHAGTGSGMEYPKNSREALLKALEIGCDGIELDVQMTADSILVTYHDQDLGSITPCTGLINSRSWLQLKECPPTIDGRTFEILRLDSFLIQAAGEYPQAEFMLDLKLFAQGEWWPYLETYSNAIVRLHSDRKIGSRLSVECMVDDFLLLIQRKRNDIPLFIYGSDPEFLMYRAVTSNYKGITVNSRHINATQVQLAQEIGAEVTLLGVDGWWGHYWSLRKKPDRLQTDSPEKLLDRSAHLH